MSMPAFFEVTRAVTMVVGLTLRMRMKTMAGRLTGAFDASAWIHSTSALPIRNQKTRKMTPIAMASGIHGRLPSPAASALAAGAAWATLVATVTAGIMWTSRDGRERDGSVRLG